MPQQQSILSVSSWIEGSREFFLCNKAIVPHEPHQLSQTMAPPGFQNQGASSSNYQGNKMQPGFHELLLVINDMKESNDT